MTLVVQTNCIKIGAMIMQAGIIPSLGCNNYDHAWL